MKRPMRSMSVYESELRMYNDAQRVRRGKERNGYAPKHFADLFSYKQPRRNDKGCGDVKWISTVSGEVKIVHCDDVRKTFNYRKPPRHSQYNLRYDRTDDD